MHDTHFSRRAFLGFAASLALGARAGAAPLRKQLPALPVEQIATDTLDIGYHAAGPETGRPVVLVHDLGYDIHSYAMVARILADRGMRVLLPHLRGHGTTRFHDMATPRSFQQAALAADMTGFIDAQHIPEAVFAGVGWGARTARAFAALKPTRCIGLVATGEAPWWNQYVEGLPDRRRDVTRKLWQRNSPASRVDEALLARAVDSFDNPDHIALLVHAHRYQLGDAAGDPRHEAAEKRLAAQLALAVPAITFEGSASVAAPLANPAAAWRGPHQHRRLAGVGHDLAHEAPQAFADAITELVRSATWRT